MFDPAWSQLPRILSARSKRASSWDRTGANIDCIKIDAGETTVLADIEGAGVITHIYFTMIMPDPLDYRDALLRMYWDGEETPSVEVPFGDFFCISNCVVRRFASLMVSVNLGGGDHTVNNGINCYFPMPFSNGARIELVNQSTRTFGGVYGRLWYHIDYDVYEDGIPDDVGRFHAQWRRENLTTPANAPKGDTSIFPGVNIGGEDNYVMLEAEGEGHIAGLFLQVDNVQGGWYGEGDDMIFIDGDTWPPSIHGTGSEEVFGGGACPDKEYAGPYTGFLLVENKDDDKFKGKNAMYRWYLQDPVRFRENVKMTIEHGHANDYASDYSSVAYWYQKEPHAAFPEIVPVAERRPRMDEGFESAHDKFEVLTARVIAAQEAYIFGGKPQAEWFAENQTKYHQAYNLMYSGDYKKADALFTEILATLPPEDA